jgi:hypothetical protein
MPNQNTHGIMCKALAVAASLGVAGFLYYLRVLGIPATGLLVALGMALFVSAMTVAVAALIFGSKTQ